jgi:hypothetical protein
MLIELIMSEPVSEAKIPLGMYREFHSIGASCAQNGRK